MLNFGVIAFCGSKGSGKSTSATLFKETFTGPTEEIAIAGHLKEVCAKVFNLDINYFLDPKLKEVELDELIVLDLKNLMQVLTDFMVNPVDKDRHCRPHVGKVLTTPRSLLQYIGTEVLHPIDPLIHIKVMIAKKDPNKLTLITDLRFAAEFEYLKTSSLTFTPVYVKNSIAEMRASSDSHASEREYVLFKNRCKELDNESNLGDLRSSIKGLIKEFYGQ